MNAHDMSEPVLSPDFAARVLGEAEAVAVRRRRTRRIIAGAGGTTCAAVVIVSWATFFRAPVASAPPRLSTLVAAASVAPASQTDDAALGYLFPDAAPVALFASQYSDANDDEGTDFDVLADEDGDVP
jgi:hypothetical protein